MAVEGLLRVPSITPIRSPMSVLTTAATTAAVLRWLVPLVVVLSFIPDLLLLQYGLSVLLVIGLMVMHVVCAAVAVPACRRVLPV